MLLLTMVFLLSACESAQTISEVDTGVLFNSINRPRNIEESIRHLTMINEEDVNWSGSRESRTIEINDYIAANDFDKISELILASGEMDVHGTFLGSLPSHYFGIIQVFLIPAHNIWQKESWFEDLYNGENYTIGLELRIGQFNDPLRIGSYTIYRDADALGNATDTINNFSLRVSWADTGITDEQILMQFISYLNAVRQMI